MIPHWITKKVIAWSLYDFADTAFSALFITFFFPILVKVHLGGNEFQIGLAMGLSVLVAALFVPLIGAMSDASGRRMPLLIITALLTAGLTALIGYAGLFLVLILGFLANITHNISKDVYDAKMIDIVPRPLFGSLSGFGVGVGYFGTIVSLAIGYPLLSYFGWENINGIRVMFWEAAAFYVLFSLPLFLFVPDRPLQTTQSFLGLLKRGLAEIMKTVKTLPRAPLLGKFLMASFLYNNGINATTLFLALYAREAIGLTTQQFFPVFAIMALAAAAGSFVFGRLSDAFGPTSMIKTVLYLWIAIIVLLLFVTTYSTFLIAGMLGGVALGAVWTLNRHMIAAISPKQKIAQFFGFEGLTGKFSGVLGPIVVGYLAASHGYPPALISVIIFIALGLILMKGVPILEKKRNIAILN